MTPKHGVKAFQVRMDPDLHSRLTTISLVTGVSMTKLIEEGIRDLIGRRLMDPEFQARLQAFADGVAQLKEDVPHVEAE